MPPKVRTTKEDIIRTTVELVRANGEHAINARAVAAALDCSTQPIFSNFATMEELRAAVLYAAYCLYADFLKKEAESGRYPEYKAYGMAYIRFAMEEKELFKLLFMRDRTGEDLTPTPDFEKSVEVIMKANNISREKAMLMHLEVWTCVHGIGAMIATSFLTFDLDTVSNMISDVYHGIRTRLLSEGN